MKKILFSFLIVIVVLIGVNFVLAKDEPNGQPFAAVWEAVDSLIEQIIGHQEKIDEQQEQIDNQQGQINEHQSAIADILERLEQLEAQECVPGVVEACDTGLLGVCSTGTKTCEPDYTWGACIQDEYPSPEVPDGLDNDCDGEIDNIVITDYIIKDDFNSYNDGPLNGQGGWYGTSSCEVQGDIVYEGEKAVKCLVKSDDDITIRADGASVPNGAQTIFFRFDNASHRFRFNLLNANNGGVINVVIYNQSARYRDGSDIFHEIVSNLEVNIWHRLQIEWRDSDNYARYKVNDGAWTDWDDTEGITTPTRFELNMSGNYVKNDFTIYYDNLY